MSTEATTLTTQWIDPAKLHPYPNNPRVEGAEIEAIEKSLREYGFNEPIITDSNLMICSGHKRLKAAQNIGMSRVPIIINPLLDDPGHFLGYLIAANRTAEIAQWDDGLRSDVLRELQGLDSLDDLESVGYSLDELDSLISPNGTEGLTDPDAVPETAPKRVKLGELWRLGRHRLICGNCVDEKLIDRLFVRQKANMVFTDPPYNVNYGVSKKPSRKSLTITNDNQTDANWLVFNRRLIDILRAICPNGDIYVWGAPGPDGMRQRLCFVDNGFHWSATIIWKKQQLVLSLAKYQRIYEACLYGWFGKSSFVADRTQTEVWQFDRPHRSEFHPSQKPVDLCAYGIGNSCRSSGIVFDPFGGSGSTMIACEQIGRECYMVELEPKYCNVIVKRWEDFTGRKAQKIK